VIGEAGPGGEARSRTSSGRTARIVALARHAAIVGIAGVITGVIVGGVGGRLLMRISAIAAPDSVTGASTEGGNVVGDITIDGTLALLLFVGILSGLVGAVAYLITEPWLRWTGRWHGPVFGLLLLAIGSTAAFDPGNQDFRILRYQELNVAMFGALFVGFGLLIVPLIARLERSMPPVDPARPVAGSWAYLALTGFGMQFLGLFFIQFFDPDATGAETAPSAVGIALIGVTVATALAWTKDLVGDRPWNRWTEPAGYGLLLVAIVLGSARALSDIGQILAL
jgi:hypothetical protein